LNEAEDRLTGAGISERLEENLHRLQNDWSACLNYWRDDRASMFEADVVRPIQESGSRLVAAYDDFMAVLNDARADVESLGGLPDYHSTWQELERRIDEAEGDWKASAGTDRRDFARDFGLFGHVRKAKEIEEYEASRGRIRGVHYEIEYGKLKHPDDGRAVRYDYVDFDKHLIIDYKPISESETIEQVAKKYKEQRRRHIEAYAHHFGVVPDYEYVTYPSSKDMYDAGGEES
jgi:hypothetical protein